MPAVVREVYLLCSLAGRGRRGRSQAMGARAARQDLVLCSFDEHTVAGLITQVK
jgi:hypothetical protein